MEWMEMIKVQTTQRNVAEELMIFVEEYKTCEGLLETKVFNHATVDDCSIWLFWNTDHTESQGSGVALSLCTALKKYGLIDHTVWVETKREEEKNHEKESDSHKT